MSRDAGISPFTQIGSVIHVHGLKGEVKILFEREVLSNPEELELVYLRSDRGDYFPARIKGIRRPEKDNNFLFFVLFEHIADRASATSLRNKEIYFRTEEINTFFGEDEEDELSLLHFDVYDSADNYYGVVTEILEHPAQDVLVVAGPKGNILVPLVDYYVVDIDEENETLTCQNLNLLEDVYDDEN